MPKKIQEIWECHLCGDDRNITDCGQSDWVELAIEDPARGLGHILSRIVCPSCVKTIKKLSK
jgi:hypothetical protein